MGTASNEQFVNNTSSTNISSSLSGTIRLFKNNFTPTGTSNLADFTEADFSGYASQGIGSGDWSDDSRNIHEKQSGIEIFIHDGGTTNNTIYGWYIEGSSVADANGDTMGDELVAFEKFASPVDMDTEFDRIEVTVEALIEMLP